MISKFRNKIIFFGVLNALFFSLSGCYYSQSVIGHSRLMLARKPVDKVIVTADETLVAQLVLSKELKAFAIKELGLPESKSYDSYVALQRDFPVWTVVAAPEFSVNPKQWCYPVIGCASYRGYFKKQSAQNYADRIAKKGFEVSVGGAPAYSTLGWFADPLLPSMMRYGDVEFAETLFHELAHQRLYINGDSGFNEAFATVVGQEGAKRWLQKFRPDELKGYQDQINATAEFNSLIAQSKKELEKIYQSDVNEQEKRELKESAFTTLHKHYEALKAQNWQGKGWFDGWFKRPINNARLASFSTYYEQVPVLEELLNNCGNDLPRFYEAVKKLGESKPIEIDVACTVN